MEEITRPICLCSSCRKPSTGLVGSIAAGCPLCGSKKVVFILDPTSLVEEHENSVALEALCNMGAEGDDVEEVASIMGITGGCTQTREDSTCIDGLASWMDECGI